MTYRAVLSGRALKQVNALPGPAFDSLIEAMAEVADYPGDPLRAFPTSDPYVRRVEFGDAGLITYLINDGARVVIILDITWGGNSRHRRTIPIIHRRVPARSSSSAVQSATEMPWARQESLSAAAR